MPIRLVFTAKLAEAAPCGTVTLAGTVTALVFELERDTTAPPVPAAAVKVTVPVPDWPPVIVLGLIDTPLSAAGTGLTETLNVLLTPEYDAVMIAELVVLTAPVVTENAVDVAP